MNLSSINEKGIDSSFVQNLSLGEYDSSLLKQTTRKVLLLTRNVTREPMLMRWWPLIVHGKAASIPNIQSILITIMHYIMNFLIHLCTHLQTEKHRSPF
jgi:hypothetical protein